MGNRVSIEFRKNEHDTSVVLFSHWRGKALVEDVEEYLKTLKREIEEGAHKGMPLGRLEPNTVMVDFIRYLTFRFARVDGDLYLGVDQHDGDNGDNGHFVIQL